MKTHVPMLVPSPTCPHSATSSPRSRGPPCCSSPRHNTSSRARHRRGSWTPRPPPAPCSHWPRPKKQSSIIQSWPSFSESLSHSLPHSFLPHISAWPEPWWKIVWLWSWACIQRQDLDSSSCPIFHLLHLSPFFSRPFSPQLSRFVDIIHDSKVQGRCSAIEAGIYLYGLKFWGND